VLVKPKGGEALVHFMEPVAGTLAGLPKPSDDPALVVHGYGKGKAIYFSGDLGNVLNSFHLLEWSRLIENSLQDLAPSPVLVEDAPRSLEVVLRSQEQGRRLVLHLVNFTGEMTRPIRDIVPLHDVRITLAAEKKVKRVSSLMHPQTLRTRRDDEGRVQFVLPRVDEYEVVVIER
jgi:hypothetical protein